MISIHSARNFTNILNSLRIPDWLHRSIKKLSNSDGLMQEYDRRQPKRDLKVFIVYRLKI